MSCAENLNSAKAINTNLFDYLIKCYSRVNQISNNNNSSLLNQILSECKCQIVRNCSLVLVGVYSHDAAYPNLVDSILTPFLIEQRVSTEFIHQLVHESSKNQINATNDKSYLDSQFALVKYIYFEIKTVNGLPQIKIRLLFQIFNL